MTTGEMQEKIKAIIEKEFGISTFAVLKAGETFSLVKFILDDNLNKTVKDMFAEILQNQFLCDEAELDKVENIDDNRHVFYEIPQSNEYKPFDFLSTSSNVTTSYNESCLGQLVGFAFRFNVNDDNIWLYQQVNYPQLINKSKNVYALPKKSGLQDLNPKILYKSSIFRNSRILLDFLFTPLYPCWI